jgi:hypothetical protein
MADVQAEMALVGARLVNLEAGKTQLEARARTPDANQGRQPAAPTDEYQHQEDFIRGQPPLVQQWLRNNRQRYFSDEAFRGKVGGAAGYAQNNLGIDQNSQEFIDYVEEQVGMRAPVLRQPDPPPVQPGGRDVAPPAPPPRQESRLVTAPAGGATSGTARTNGVREVHLTAAEIAQADRDGVTREEYARAKWELQEEGRIGPNAVNR